MEFARIVRKSPDSADSQIGLETTVMAVVRR